MTPDDGSRPASAPFRTPEALRFGAFRLDIGARRLTKDGAELRVGSRAMDLLLALATHAGQTLSHEDLFAAVWPDTVVEESNLRVTITALRRVLGTAAIENIPGRGYRLAIPLARPAPPPAMIASTARIYGRDATLEDIETQTRRRGFLTLTGPGGIGKTTLAARAAELLAPNYPDGVVFVDFASLSARAGAVEHLAALLQVPTAEAQATRGIVAFLAARQVLLVLDNCERVVDAMAPLCAAIAAQAHGTHILATSREPLAAAGEWVLPVGPLALPPPGRTLTPHEALTFPAIRLFAERAAATGANFALDDDNVADAIGVCARLDGLPLAIELAAARLNTLGLAGLRDGLDDRFAILTRGRRDADPRHRSLTAMVDWSHDTLSDTSRKVWRRLAVFPGAFSLDGAQAVAGSTPAGEADFSVVDAIGDLVSKSLLVADCNGDVIRYRLLETMRHYALRKLSDAGEAPLAHGRHARHCLARLRAEAPRWGNAEYDAFERARVIADVRTALEWAFMPLGEPRMAIELIVASAPLWFRQFLVPELRDHLECAQAAARNLGDIDPLILTKLHLALGHSIFHTRGPGKPVHDALCQGIVHSIAAGETTLRFQLIWSLYGHAAMSGDYADVTRRTDEFRTLQRSAGTPRGEASMLDMMAMEATMSGRHADGVRHARAALEHPAVPRGARHDHAFVYDHHAAAGAHLARALFLSGCCDEALGVARETIERAAGIDRPYGLGYALVCAACPIALWAGDRAAASRYVDQLTKLADGVARDMWQSIARGYREILAAADEGRNPIVADAALPGYHQDTFATIHPALMTAAVRARAMGAPVWSTPEILRIDGLRHLAAGDSDAAHAAFRKAIDLAHEQGALVWELRAATSLARSFVAQGRHAAARDALAPVHARLTEGWTTQDATAATALLRDL